MLAGANRPGSADPLAHDDRGILTAEAIAGLDLSGLELVVLSACETGLGQVGGGEGVFGFQRAFHLAGAQNVVASLWKVDDQATAALMAIFYRSGGRQAAARGPAQAQLALPPARAGRQARGGTRDAGFRQAGAASGAEAGLGRLVGTASRPAAAVGGVCAVG